MDSRCRALQQPLSMTMMQNVQSWDGGVSVWYRSYRLFLKLVSLLFAPPILHPTDFSIENFLVYNVFHMRTIYIIIGNYYYFK